MCLASAATVLRGREELRVTARLEIVHDPPGEIPNPFAALERPLRIFDRNDVTGIVIGHGIGITARQVIEIERASIRLDSNVERYIEPPELADDRAGRMRPRVIAGYCDNGGL